MGAQTYSDDEVKVDTKPAEVKPEVVPAQETNDNPQPEKGA